MRLQEITATKSEYCEMYFRGGVILENAIHAGKGERVSFDTYFNSFDYPKYLENTSVKQVTVSLSVFGEGDFILCTYDGEREKEEKAIEKPGKRLTSQGGCAIMRGSGGY